jgi:hypothetical protein
MSDPDSIVEYVRWLDGRHQTLREAVANHRISKTQLSIPGSIDGFDHELWRALDAAYESED